MSIYERFNQIAKSAREKSITKTMIIIAIQKRKVEYFEVNNASGPLLPKLFSTNCKKNKLDTGAA